MNDRKYSGEEILELIKNDISSVYFTHYYYNVEIKTEFPMDRKKIIIEEVGFNDK